MTRFLDTNILVYAQQRHEKGAIARAELAEGGEISVQVLNEFANVLRRKLQRTWPEVEQALDDISLVLPAPRPLTFKTHRLGLSICRDVGCGIYDALILASAQEAGCSEVLSEDMQDGRHVGAVTIRNPFR